LNKPEGDANLDINNYYRYGSLLKVASMASGLPDLSHLAPRVYLPERVKPNVDRLGLSEKFIVLHTRSNEEQRNWSSEKWEMLQKMIHQGLGIPTVEIGLEPSIPDGLISHRNLCGHRGLVEIAEIIARATAFVGIDSGPAHFANAVGTPGVVLLGKYRSFDRYLPYTGGYADGTLAELVYAHGPVSSLPVEHVYLALTKIIQRCSSGAMLHTCA
jgi:ADP-heptose:LPS heptosyltransferase